MIEPVGLTVLRASTKASVSCRLRRITAAKGMAGWRKRLFAVGHDVADAIDYFGLPLERTILVGSEIPL